jgi:hypothetical protein
MNSLSSYMFWPPIVAIFSEVFFEGHRTQNSLIYKYNISSFKQKFKIYGKI